MSPLTSRTARTDRLTHSHYSNAADRFINARVRLWRPFVANLFAEHLAAIAEVVEATADEDLDACFALAKEPKPAAKSGGKGGGAAGTKRTESQLACLMAHPGARQALIERATEAAGRPRGAAARQMESCAMEAVLALSQGVVET